MTRGPQLSASGYKDCVDCGRPMRPKGRAREEFPGTITHHSDGQCSSCAKRKERGTAPVEYTARPDNCVKCGHPMRPRQTFAHDHPGTLEHAGNGICSTCYTRERKGYKKRDASTTPTEWPAPCANCAHPMRPGHTPAASHPGTRRHTGGGICAACYTHQRKTGELPSKPPPVKARPYAEQDAAVTAAPGQANPEPTAVPGLDPALDAMMRRRRERLARQQRIAQIRRKVA